MKPDFQTELKNAVAEIAEPPMKILAISDIHGSYNETRQLLGRESADILIIAGDLTTKGTLAEAKMTLESFKQVCPVMVAVCGNMDSPSFENLYTELDISINGTGKIFRDVGIFGVSGAPVSWMKTPYEISEEEIYKRAKAGYEEVKHCRIKIFVPHAPPFNTFVDKITNGSHVGSTGVRKFIEECKPDVCICGHIHEARGKDVLGKTVIVNCGPAKNYYATIDVGEEIVVMVKEQ